MALVWSMAGLFLLILWLASTVNFFLPRLMPGDPRFYLDFTGTGNTFNLLHPRTLQLVMDSLRYWVLEMHVDGFRFDLMALIDQETMRQADPRALYRFKQEFRTLSDLTHPNLVNLYEHIAPTMAHADVVVRKGADRRSSASR